MLREERSVLSQLEEARVYYMGEKRACRGGFARVAWFMFKRLLNGLPESEAIEEGY